MIHHYVYLSDEGDPMPQYLYKAADITYGWPFKIRHQCHAATVINPETGFSGTLTASNTLYTRHTFAAPSMMSIEWIDKEASRQIKEKA